jgi:phage terminase small subunit
MTKPKAAPEDDDSDLGPCMRELSEKQRRFVQIYLEQPLRSGASVAVAAGYKSGTNCTRVEAFRQLRNERVLRAIREELDKRFRSDAVIGRAVLMEIALDKEHPQRLKAATALLDRGGFHSMSEQRITVDHRDLTGEAMRERITALALELNIDPMKLLGHNGTGEIAPAENMTIEGETVEAEAVTAPAAPAPRVMRYVPHAMLSEYSVWQAQHTARNDADLVEVTWAHEREPVMPDTRPMTAG